MELRDLTGDADALRALSHRVRLAVLEALGRDGALTASEAGRLLGESAGTMSWHFTVLAKHGFVVEAEGSGRRRPWKLAADGQRWDAAAPDPEERAAGQALARLVLHRDVRRIESWMDRRSDAPTEWQRAGDLHSARLHLTADEAADVASRVAAILAEYGDRLGHPEVRPAGTVPVDVLFTMSPELS